MAEDRRTPERAAAHERELDAKVEALARQIAEVVNSAGVESRQNLREYAVDLLREETERDDAAPTTSSAPNATTNFSPLAFAIGGGLPHTYAAGAGVRGQMKSAQTIH